jgi:hypothetical protein
MAYPRTCNLFGSHFCGVEMRQYWADLALWELFLNAHRDIKTVVELGAFHGGLTLFLKAQTLARGQEFYSLDRDLPEALGTDLSYAMHLPAYFIQGDWWKEANEDLLGLLSDPKLKPLLLFVDGGNKAKEFAAFVPHLSEGDYAGVHDYGTEFKPEDAEVVGHLLLPVFWEECLSPPQPCLTRFWKRL